MSGTAPKVDSNITGLSYAEEETLGVLPATPVWRQLEPNSYEDFGGEITTLARNPINPGRQRKKGVVTDLDADGGFNTDLTLTNLQDILQGLFFASLRRKGEFTDIGAVTSTTLALTATAGFYVGSLVKTTDMGLTVNNKVGRVTTVTTNTSITVSEGYSAETNAPAASKVTVVGHQFAVGDASIDVSGDFAALVTVAKNLTELSIVPGEWVYLGGDETAEQFGTAACNGFKRVRSVTATRMTFDKSDQDMANDSGSGKTIRIYLARVLKNETGSGIVRRSYNVERTLGSPDLGNPTDVQAEYLIGAVPNEATFNIKQADKLTVDLSFVAIDNVQRTTTEGVKSGTRATLAEADAFNTSSDFVRLRMALVSTTDEAPDPLFAYLTELTFKVNNNITPNKAVAVLGAFDVTAGTFAVDSEITAYFSTVQAVQAVRNNADVTLDAILAKDNYGIAFDVPLIALGNGRLNIEQDQPITLPLTAGAATAAKIDASLNHTFLICFFDYLPTAAG